MYPVYIACSNRIKYTRAKQANILRCIIFHMHARRHTNNHTHESIIIVQKLRTVRRAAGDDKFVHDERTNRQRCVGSPRLG